MRFGTASNRTSIDPAQVFGNGAELTASERVESIRSMAVHGMDDAQLNAAYAFLESTEIPEVMTEGSYRWMTDELFTALRNQENVPADLVERLSSIAKDGEQDVVVRDYALNNAQQEQRLGANYDLTAKAHSILQSDYPEEAKISALEVLGENRDNTSQELITTLANNEETPVALRTKANYYLNHLENQ